MALPADPPSVDAALRTAAARLATTSETPRLDAELLMAHALGIGRDALLLGRRDTPEPKIFAALVARRAGGEPIAYITGRRDFWAITLQVGPGVLIPRPDSETLIEAAVDHFGAAGPARVLDLGTGPGTLLLAALDHWPQATGLGIDMSPVALDYARDNATLLGVADRALFRQGDWTDGIDERFDLILCNPPYIGDDEPLSAEVAAHEPSGALFAGADGLDAYRVLVPRIVALLAPGGLAAVEIGATQGAAVTALFAAIGAQTQCRRDLAGRDRAVLFVA
jgi:release factor glutamine methyltransferase